MKVINKMMRYLNILLIILTLNLFKVHAQLSREIITPIGTPAPYFKLNVKNAKTGAWEVKTLDSYKGKWLLLEFWSKTCAVCIYGLPKLNSLSKSLADRMDVLLVGSNDNKYNKGIEEFYERLANQNKLSLAIAFDSVIFSKYKINALPHVVIIDTAGVVRSVPYSQELDESKLLALFDHHNNLFFQKPGYGIKPLPLGKSNQMNNGNFAPIVDSLGIIKHGSKLSFYSKEKLPKIKIDLSKGLQNDRFEVSGTSLERLYMLAYFGKSLWYYKDSLNNNTWIKPIIKTKDTIPFVYNAIRGEGLYTYQTTLHHERASVNILKQVMQNDLKKWFGYNVRIEVRNMPVWKMVVLDSAIVKGIKTTNNSENAITGDASKFIFKNATTDDMLSKINYYHPAKRFYNETFLNFNIDLQLDANITDLAQVRNCLKRYGLDLVKGVRKMKVLVIE